VGADRLGRAPFNPRPANGVLDLSAHGQHASHSAVAVVIDAQRPEIEKSLIKVPSMCR
jgi:hypothetical protein